MADVKISALPAATTPLAGTEVLPIVQSSTTKKVAISDVTAGRAISASSLTLTTTPLAVGSGGTGLTSLTAGYIPFGAGTSAFGNDSNLFWNNTNKRLGIGTTSPSQPLVVSNSGAAGIEISPTATASSPTIVCYNRSSLTYVQLTTHALLHDWTVSGTQAMRLDASGNLAIGSTTAYGKLDVLGNGNANNLHIANSANTDTGAYINATGVAECMFSGGASYNSYSAPNFVMNAKSTVASGVYLTGDTIRFWVNTGLTAGTTFNQSEKVRIDSSGNLLVTGTGGLGYGTGSGGAVTQITSRTTGVTLNKTNGAITLFTAAGSTTATTFTVTNSTVAATDVIHVSQKSGANLYVILVTAVAAGSFNITFYTTGGTTSEAPVFNFVVMKAVTA